jgi:thiamine pyrophosphokinase
VERWKHFINALTGYAQVFVVGPLFRGRNYVAQGPTIYVDGGSQFRPIDGNDADIPSITVGDGDSTATKLDVILPKNKDYSDLAFVLQTLPANVRHVELLGFLGGRRDHELINYGEVHRFLSTQALFTTVRFDDAIVAFSGGSLKIQIDGTFSVCVLEEASLRIAGACHYTLETETKVSPASSLGLSNVGQGTVVIDCDKPCFLFLS